jgi:hypothetical protein
MDDEERRRQNKDLDELWESIGRGDIDFGYLAAQEHLAAGRPVYGDADGLTDDEVLKEYPDGRKEVVRFEGDDVPTEIFVRIYQEPEK